MGFLTGFATGALRQANHLKDLQRQKLAQDRAIKQKERSQLRVSDHKIEKEASVASKLRKQRIDERYKTALAGTDDPGKVEWMKSQGMFDEGIDPLKRMEAERRIQRTETSRPLPKGQERLVKSMEKGLGMGAKASNLLLTPEKDVSYSFGADPYKQTIGDKLAQQRNEYVWRKMFEQGLPRKVDPMRAEEMYVRSGGWLADMEILRNEDLSEEQKSQKMLEGRMRFVKGRDVMANLLGVGDSTPDQPAQPTNTSTKITDPALIAKGKELLNSGMKQGVDFFFDPSKEAFVDKTGKPL